MKNEETVTLLEATTEECCCNCLHDIRSKGEKGYVSNCEIDGHYISFADSFYCRCKNWKPEYEEESE